MVVSFIFPRIAHATCVYKQTNMVHVFKEYAKSKCTDEYHYENVQMKCNGWKNGNIKSNGLKCHEEIYIREGKIWIMVLCQLSDGGPMGTLGLWPHTSCCPPSPHTANQYLLVKSSGKSRGWRTRRTPLPPFANPKDDIFSDFVSKDISW